MGVYFHTFLSQSLSHNEVMRSLQNDFKKDYYPRTVSTFSDQKTCNRDTCILLSPTWVFWLTVDPDEM